MKTKIEKYKDYLVDWLKGWFENNGADCKAVIGISGGKDSTTVAALCVQALGKDRVLGVLMPNGTQTDIDDSYAVCEHLGINYVRININTAYNAILNVLDYNGIDPSNQTKVNLAPRIRMSALYAVAQSVNGRVVGTGNASESFAGYFTRYGDGAYDVNPIGSLTMEEVVELGLLLGVPERFMLKAPSDGLTGKTDDEAFKEKGYSYSDISKYIKNGTTGNKETDKILTNVHSANMFKQHLGDIPELETVNFE